MYVSPTFDTNCLYGMLQFYYKSVVRCLCGSMCLLHAGAHCSVPSAQCSLHAKVTEVPRLDTVKLLDGGGGWGVTRIRDCYRMSASPRGALHARG